MSSREIVQRVIEETEARSGCPVQVSRDASVRQQAVSDVARGSLHFHRIRINPAFDAEADYLICLQCGFILRKFSVPADERYDFAANQKGRKEAEALIRAHFAGRGLPAETLRVLRDQLFNGLMLHLLSVPLSLRVNAWLADIYPDLGLQQKNSITSQLQENMASLKPEVRRVAPERIARPTLVISSAFAAYWARLWGDDLLTLPYRSANLGQPGLRLLELFDTTPADPTNDLALVDAWAKELGLNRWYDWTPYRLG
jgi:hypothetical protein